MRSQDESVPRFAAWTLGLCLWAVLAGCQGETNPKPQTEEAASEQRILTLDPGVLEVVVRLGAEGQLVGRPDYSDEWAQLAQLPTVGTALSPNYEAIVRTRPQRILTTASRGAVVTDLSAIAPTRVIPWLTVPQVAEGIRTIGTDLGRGEAAAKLAQNLEEGLTSRVGPDSPSVLLLLGAPSDADPQLWYIKPDSLHGAALSAAGGRNAIETQHAGPPSISVERLIALDPDVVLIMIAKAPLTDESREKHLSFWSRFDMLEAVKHQRIEFIVGPEYYRIGPDVLEFSQAISQRLESLRP